jgi:hypothetical protein
LPFIPASQFKALGGVSSTKLLEETVRVDRTGDGSAFIFLVKAALSPVAPACPRKTVVMLTGK